LSGEDNEDIGRAREVFIRLSLLAIMGVSCFLLLRPFLNLLISGIIIAVAIYPGYRALTTVLRGRGRLGAVLCTALLLLAVIVPSVLLAGTLADGVSALAHQLEAGRINIPPPPLSLSKLPVIGSGLNEFWSLCSTNLSEVASQFGPEIRERIPALLSATARIGGAIIQFLVSIVLAGLLLATSEGNARFASRVFDRVFGEQGPEFEQLVAATIRSVTNGILGVALIQSVFASIGFWYMGLPGAGLWAVTFLIASVLQVGPLVLVPAVLYVFAAYPTSPAIIFLVWCLIVGLIDNVLKPILLGRGSKVPMPVIFLGALGGFVALRIIGLFVGAIILSVGYKLFIAWLDAGMPGSASTRASATKAN
jgi:predicted PurR-regulated permease PerM